MPLRVLHLVGSAESDFLGELSRLYAADCLEATHDRSRYEFHVAHVTPDGAWRFPRDLSDAAMEASEPLAVDEAVRRLVALELDAMVPQMFCLAGMTSYRALFDVIGVPHLGNAASVMALAANKARARAVVAAAGVSVPHGEVVRAGSRPGIEPPVVIKPVDADNSLGVTLVRERADYDRALDEAFMHADEALVEAFVEPGREVRCGILDRGGELVCLPLEEYDVAGSTPIRGYGDKITRREDGELKLVAKETSKAWIVDSTDPISASVEEAALRCHDALGCRHYSLFDFRIDRDGHPWFLEAGLYCSFARQSVIAVMAEAAGISTDELFATVLASALGDRGRAFS